MSAGRAVRVKIRASEAERAEWHAKARSAGLTLSDLVRRSVGRCALGPGAHRGERERTRQVARIGNNLNQTARLGNTHRGAVEAVEVTGHLIAIEPGSRQWPPWYTRTPILTRSSRTGPDRPGPPDYLLGARDAAETPREGVEVLRGDPLRVAAL